MLMWIAIFGGLHINVTVLKTAVNLVESCEWTGAVWFRHGKADSFLKASHITPKKTSPLGLAPSMGKGTPRTCEG